MKSLEEHEKNFWEQHNKKLKQWVPANIACPECGSELEFDSTVLLMSNPPQRKARCSNCNWVGTIH